jgi:hypothetical protein
MDWTAMIGLGTYHGINPGMGWLFAVALGMQARRASAMWQALPPIALGHAVAVGVVVAIVAGARVALPLDVLKVVIAAALVTLGGYRLWRHRHPRFGGMQVGFRDLTIWSFLMASAHGAGLMVVPFVMDAGDSVSAVAAVHGQHAPAAMAGARLASSTWIDAMAVGIHTFSYLLVSTVIAWVVYRKLGVAFLRVAWFNLDWVWSGALVITGIFVVLS